MYILRYESIKDTFVRITRVFALGEIVLCFLVFVAFKKQNNKCKIGLHGQTKIKISYLAAPLFFVKCIISGCIYIKAV